jgi:ribonuclease HII
MNLLRASLWALSLALAGLPSRADHVLVDGRDLPPDLTCPGEAIIGGDSLSASIAAASIVAKVTRDALMRSVCPTYPRYVFSSNKGYPSPPHVAALDQHGPCVLHRHTWVPIRSRTTPRLDLQLDPPSGGRR